MTAETFTPLIVHGKIFIQKSIRQDPLLCIGQGKETFI